MIGTIDIRVQAAKPNFPLEKIRAFLNSPSSLRLRNVPREIGKWEITEVFVSANYPDNSMPSVKAVETAGIYVATLPASSVAGSSANGYTVTANGIDENGAAVEGYILGKGDLEILNADGTITVGETTYYIHIVPTKPAKPHKGDFALDTQELFDGEKWISLGGSSSVEWDAILNKPNFKAVATSGSYNDLTDKPKIPEGAIVLTTNGSKIFKDGVELTSYAALLRFVQAGGVTLMGTVGADKDALYYPLFCDDNAIRFDATGTLGGDVKTKSYTVQPVNGDSIRVGEGPLVDLAKKSDIPTDYAKTKNIPIIYVVGAEDMSAFDEAIFEAFVDEYGSTVKRYEGSKLRFVVGDDGTLLCVNKISGKTLTISASDKSFFDYKLTQTTGSYVSTFYAKKLAFLDRSDVVAPASDMDFSSDANKDKVPTCGSVGAALGRRLSTSGGTMTGTLNGTSIKLSGGINAKNGMIIASYVASNSGFEVGISSNGLNADVFRPRTSYQGVSLEQGSTLLIGSIKTILFPQKRVLSLDDTRTVTLAVLDDLVDKLTDSDLDTLCTACGITTTGKDRAAKLLALFTENTKLSGITSQDIADFNAKYKGDVSGENIPFAVSGGDIIFYTGANFYVEGKTYNGPLVSQTDIAKDADFSPTQWQTTASEGINKIYLLAVKLKAALFADTAFSESVKENANYAVVEDITNRSVKRVTISGDTAMTVILPRPTASSGVIDFEVWFDASAYTGTYPSIGYKYDATTDADVITKDGEDLAYGDGAVTIVHFTSVNGSAYTAVAASFK